MKFIVIRRSSQYLKKRLLTRPTRVVFIFWAAWRVFLDTDLLKLFVLWLIERVKLLLDFNLFIPWTDSYSSSSSCSSESESCRINTPLLNCLFKIDELRNDILWNFFVPWRIYLERLRLNVPVLFWKYSNHVNLASSFFMTSLRTLANLIALWNVNILSRLCFLRRTCRDHLLLLWYCLLFD